MTAHEPTKWSNVIAALAALDLLLFGGLVGVTLWTGEGSVRLFSLLWSVCLLVEALLWILCVIQVLRIFLRPNANEGDVFLGISEALLVLVLTPTLFRMGIAQFISPGEVLSYMQNAPLIRFWGLSHLMNGYLLFVRFLGLRWLKSPEPAPLTLADLSTSGTSKADGESESKEQ